MKKTFLYLLAVVLLTSCNNLHPKELTIANSTNQTAADANSNFNTRESNSSTRTESGLFIQTKNATIVWTPEEKSTFMAACVEGKTENMGEAKSNNYCACLLGKLEKLYPVADEVINLPEKKQISLSKECLQ
jgi:hypothetical protein